MKILLATAIAATVMATAANADGISFGSTTTIGLPGGVGIGHGTGLEVGTDGKTVTGNFGSRTEAKLPGGVSLGHGTQFGGSTRCPIPNGQRMTEADQVASHRRTHGPEPQKADPLHPRILGARTPRRMCLSLVRRDPLAHQEGHGAVGRLGHGQRGQADLRLPHNAANFPGQT